MFNNAIDALNGYWHGKTHNGFEICSKKVLCVQEPEPYGDHEVVGRFLDSVVREIMQNPGYADLLEELMFFTKHSVLLAYLLQFAKCTDIDSACSHCSAKPVAPSSEEIMRFVRLCPGQHVPLPTDSTEDQGHYLTWLEVRNLVETGRGHVCQQHHLLQRRSLAIESTVADGSLHARRQQSNMTS